MRVQRSAEHHVVPWANGLGVTADVFLWPAEAEEWTWRLSIADVSDDLPFSVMPGIDRHIMVAHGAGMALTVGGAPEHRMDTTTLPLSFAGEAATTCRLLDGPIQDLNLMVRRGHGTGSLRNVSMSVGKRLEWSKDDIALVVVDGLLTFDGIPLHTFDAVLLDSDPGYPQLVAQTHSRVAVAEIRLT
ncbi:MAG: histidine utilization protein HutD [Ilumatobacteraceae bacterium]|nr:histidine utilization protein HutD [Ilumatobacteraceae bacterium]